MGLSTTHLLILLAIIVVVFGTKKLRNIGADLGAAVKGFKDGMKHGAEKASDAAPHESTALPDASQQPSASVHSAHEAVDVPVKKNN